MVVTITFSPTPDGSDELRGFTHFWLRYVHGFSPHFHCQKSLRGENDPRFRKGMRLGQTYALAVPARCRYIYLCGVAPHHEPGLHLALEPQPDALATVTTHNGIEISVTGADQLDIPTLPDGYAGLGREFTTCRNWQFGVAYFGMSDFRPELVKDR